MNNKGKPEEPMIRVGDQWLPACDVWHKMETANVVVDTIDRFNKEFPHLASANTRAVVPMVKQRLRDIELRMPYRISQEELAALAREMLTDKPPEDVLDILTEQHGADFGMLQLIQLTGEAAYLEALRREAGELEANRISPEQAAQLWNDLSRPAPGGGRWNAALVRDLQLDAASP